MPTFGDFLKQITQEAIIAENNNIKNRATNSIINNHPLGNILTKLIADKDLERDLFREIDKLAINSSLFLNALDKLLPKNEISNKDVQQIYQNSKPQSLITSVNKIVKLITEKSNSLGVVNHTDIAELFNLYLDIKYEHPDPKISLQMVISLSAPKELENGRS